MVVLFLLIAAANRGPAIRHRWARQTFLHRPYTLEASDAWARAERTQARLQYRWEYFPGFRETNNLLLLYVSPYGFWPIAKRGFATTGDLEYFKGLLLTHVRHGTFLPLQQQAFPVVLTPGRAPGLQPARTAADSTRAAPHCAAGSARAADRTSPGSLRCRAPYNPLFPLT